MDSGTGGAGGTEDDFERRFGEWFGVPNRREVGAGGMKRQSDEWAEVMDGLGGGAGGA
jgi:hypothetical protein